MDHLHERLERLEQRTHTVERQLRWWRGLTCALVVLSLLSLALSSGKAADAQSGTLADRLAAWREEVATLRDTLVHMTTHIKSATNAQGVPEVVITGANLRIVNGLGSTDCTDNDGNPIPDCPNGLGNLIVGYNEPREEGESIRTGSHNVVVGQLHNFSRFGGLVIGSNNEISGDFASVSGGEANTASGVFASVSAGLRNTASGEASAVSGGVNNTASGQISAVSGGGQNTASGQISAVSGGDDNTASGQISAVSGGLRNIASGDASSVSGGRFNTASGRWSAVSAGDGNIASGDASSVSGGGTRLFTVEGRNIASGIASSVSGGRGNTASGEASAVSGGLNRTAEEENDWVAGPLFADE